MENRSDVGLFGLAVMGRNLALNLLDHGYSLSAYNRNPERSSEFLSAEGPRYKGLRIATTVADFVASLATPRKIILMVKAGEAVDEAMAGILPYLQAGDILMDGGNSHYKDSERRFKACAAQGIHFVGLGVSGGEEGARHGPSLMAGASPEAWAAIKPMLEAIAARADDGSPCAALLGPGGSGHFVKMVHNAIEYADMELIAESYHLMKSSFKISPDEMRTIFSEWNKTELSSYLIGLTADVLGVRDPEGDALVDLVLDSAGQKGTGAWAAQVGLELGLPVGLLAEAVYARSLSALKDERVAASAILGGPKSGSSGERQSLVEDLRKALLAAKVVAYAQGFLLLRGASKEYGWNLDMAKVALVWRAGCIIRSGFLDRIAEAYGKERDLPSLLGDSYFKTIMDSCLPSLRKVSAKAIEHGFPVPAFTAAIAFYDGYRSTWLPANLIQALRDSFGAHRYERIDRPRGETFHSEWK